MAEVVCCRWGVTSQARNMFSGNIYLVNDNAVALGNRAKGTKNEPRLVVPSCHGMVDHKHQNK